MALALQPELVILDEPTTALDVVVQREILQQVQELQQELGFSVLFITHDLSLLLEFADRIAIMYAGEIVETATAEQLAQRAAASLHAGAAAVVPAAARPADAAHRHPRVAPGPREPAGRLPLPSALPALRARRTPASTCGRRPSVRCSRESSRGTRSRATSSREADA